MAMRDTVRGMELDLKKAAALLEVSVGLVAKKAVFDLGRGLIERTPVDTGTARANWQAAQGGSPAAVVQEYGGTAQRAAGKAMATGNTLVFSDAYSTFWWLNGLPYIEALEFGHSTQAPEGMVRLAMAEVEARFDEFIDEATSEAGL
jgi:hypothetical protein